MTKQTTSRCVRPLNLLPVVLAAWLSTPLLAQWTPPTPEELSMTAQPQVPGAPAVYLYREETTEDSLHVFIVYVRLKVLTERGKQFGTVVLPYYQTADGGGKKLEDIQGRTIHPDGTIIPFKDKPLDKMVEKTGEVKFMSKTFSLPDVEVGSILEYRYRLQMDDHFFSAPDWYIQSNLFTRKAYYRWRPTSRELTDNSDGGKLTSGIAWLPVLPPGADIKMTQFPSIANAPPHTVLELSLADVPPAPEEEHMPPIHSLSYRVLFYYTPYHSPAEFWKAKGQTWSKRWDKFIGPGPAVQAEVQRLSTPSDSQEQKLKSFYTAIMSFENTDFTREHSHEEDKAGGLRDTRTTDDILLRKRGSSDQLAALFVAMARAAGMKAYMATVTNRDRNLFSMGYLNMGQLNDSLAVVNVDGKDRFFDPGSRFCPFGHLAWKHTLTTGLRQMEKGADFFNSPGESYTESKTTRIAELKMDDQGSVTGIVRLTFNGAPALHWRQVALRTDSENVSRDLHRVTEHLLPGGMDIKLKSLEGLTEYEKPLVVSYDVKGTVGSSTGKRLVVPASLFEVNTTPAFPHEKRDTSVYFDYPFTKLDAVRITFAPGVVVESLPSKESAKLQNMAAYTLTAESTPNTVTMRRNFVLGDVLVSKKDYPDLRAFYAKVENKDQESVVLTHAAEVPAPKGN